MRGNEEELIARRDCADYILNLKRPPSDADPNADAGVHAVRGVFETARRANTFCGGLSFRR